MHHNTTHGLSKTNAYKSWNNARLRCYNPNNKDYKHYGQKGLGMDSEWKEDFAKFYADMGECPKGFTLERIDVSKGYVKGNCKWIPKSEQNSNKGNNHFITYCGETKTISQWAKETGVPQRTIWDRLQYGWELDKVLSAEKFSIRTPLTLNGQTMCIMDWARKTGLGESTIRRRLKLGWSVEKALTTQIKGIQ